MLYRICKRQQRAGGRSVVTCYKTTCSNHIFISTAKLKKKKKKKKIGRMQIKNK